VTEQPTPEADAPPADVVPERPISDAARRALQEAAERRAQAQSDALPPEQGGPRGLEPTRYGDWEKKGLAVDF
jgi:hypothetical protein